jgi:hypothetical protein
VDVAAGEAPARAGPAVDVGLAVLLVSPPECWALVGAVAPATLAARCDVGAVADGSDAPHPPVTAAVRSTTTAAAPAVPFGRRDPGMPAL